MAAANDIEKIAEQENQLIFDSFDEAKAFEIGSALRLRGVASAMPIVIDIRTWDRLLFYAALPGSTLSNAEWVRRKLNVVKMFQCSTYRKALEERPENKLFNPQFGLNAADYVLAGGGFPIKVRGTGVIGAIGVSGLPQRQDHELIVAVLCDQLGLDFVKLELGPE